MGLLSKSKEASLEKQGHPAPPPPPYTYAPSSGHAHAASSSTAPHLPQVAVPVSGPPTPVKTFNISNAGFWTHKNLLITFNGQVVVHVIAKSGAMGLGPPVLKLSTDPNGGAVVAAAKCKVSCSSLGIGNGREGWRSGC